MKRFFSVCMSLTGILLSAAADAGSHYIETPSLAARVHQVEHRIYPAAVSWFADGRLVCRDDTVWLDGAPLAQPVQL